MFYDKTILEPPITNVFSLHMYILVFSTSLSSELHYTSHSSSYSLLSLSAATTAQLSQMQDPAWGTRQKDDLRLL